MWYSDDRLPSDGLEDFLSLYADEYDYLYENDDDPGDGFSYDILLAAGEVLLEEGMPVMAQCVEYRQDPFTSDRELAAFALAAIKSDLVDLEQ